MFVYFKCSVLFLSEMCIDDTQCANFGFQNFEHNNMQTGGTSD